MDPSCLTRFIQAIKLRLPNDVACYLFLEVLHAAVRARIYAV